MMGAKNEIFPTFSELCALAREVEKKPLSIPPRPIDGKLAMDDTTSIFPREFEDYTYSYLIFEAQKVERRLSNLAIASTPQEKVVGTPHLTPAQMMESDLRKFVEAQEQSEPPGENDDVSIARSEPKSFFPTRRVSAQSLREEQRATAPEEELPIPEKEPEEQAPIPFPPTKARILPPVSKLRPPTALPEKAQASPPPLPSASARPPMQKAAPQIPPAKPPTIAARQPSAPIQQDAEVPSPDEQYAPASVKSSKMPTEPLAVEQEKEDAPVAKLPAGVSSYSKLSPRLQALMEAKLRREEEKARKRQDDSEIFKQPPAPSEDEEEGEKGQLPPELMIDPQEERGEENEQLPSRRPLRPTEDEREDAPLPEDREVSSPIKQPATPQEEEQRKLRLRKLMDEAAPSAEDEAPAPEDEGELAEKEEEIVPPKRLLRPPEDEEEAALEPEEEKPAAQQISRKGAVPEQEDEAEEAEPEIRAKPPEEEPARAGPITIKPMFPDAAQPDSAKAKPASASEESDRMRRIQRIIEELSPDKARAKPVVMPKQEEDSFEDDDKPDEPAPPVQKPAAASKKKKEALAATAKKADAGKKGRAKKGKMPAPIMPEQEEEQQGEALDEEPEEQAPVPKKLPILAKKIPRAPLKEVPEENEDEPIKPATKKSIPRTPAKDEPEEQEETPIRSPPAALQLKAQKKLMPRVPVQETGEAEPPPQKKLAPRLPARAKTEEEELPAPKKLIPRIPMREAEPDEEEERAAPVRRRILPGMARTQPSTPQTYVPPARGRAAPVPRDEEELEHDEERAEIPAPKKVIRSPPPDEQEEPEEQETPAPSALLAPLKPRKLVSDEPLPEAQKTPEQLAQDEKMRKMAEQLARLEASRVKEVSGTAHLPVQEEDIPLPEAEDDGVPKPQDYEQAKEGLRKSLERDEVARKVRIEDEAAAEQFAKEHMVWLYEIYKMGGMPREDFVQKAVEKYKESKNGAQPAPGSAASEAPPNPALANLGKVIEKKDKK